MIQDLQKALGIKQDGNIGPVTMRSFGKKYELNDIQLAHFFGQCHHETLGFTMAVENLNYSAAGLLTTFKKYFDPVTAKQFERKPEMIANRVYANRMGNGPYESGDGWKYRGRTPIHLTGKDQYKMMSDIFKIDFVSNPDLALDYGFDIAYTYFRKNKIFEMCKDLEDNTIKSISIKINGGTNGLEKRAKHTKEYYSKLLGNSIS